MLSPSTVPFSYLYEAVGTPESAVHLANHARGAAYPAVNDEDFENATMLKPNSDRFHHHVAPTLELVRVLTGSNANLRATRDLLLPKLVAGDIDVNDLYIDTEWLVA